MKQNTVAQPAQDDCQKTGLVWPQTWNGAYIFVMCSFVLWVVLLIVLTELSA
jgi:hypothetical protein